MKMKPHKALACSYMLYFTGMCKKKPFPNKMLGFGFLSKLKQKYIHVQLKDTCQIRQTQKSEVLQKVFHELDRLM